MDSLGDKQSNAESLPSQINGSWKLLLTGIFLMAFKTQLELYH